MSCSKPAAVLLGLALVLGCSGPDSEEVATAVEEAASLQVLASRGEVVAMPEPGDPQNLIQIHHEALDTLKGRDGTVIGMDAMTMPMAIAEGVSLDGIAVGDKVEFTLEVDWEARPGMKVTEIAVLPADTELVFRGARPE